MAEVVCVSNMLESIRGELATPNHHELENAPVAKALVTSNSKSMLLCLMVDACVPYNQITIKLSIMRSNLSMHETHAPLATASLSNLQTSGN